jgi:hypothetical protein
MIALAGSSHRMWFFQPVTKMHLHPLHFRIHIDNANVGDVGL